MTQYNHAKLLYKSRDDTTGWKGDLSIRSFSINIDLLASSSSEVVVYEKPNNLNVGDLVVIKTNDGITIFSGTISQIEENKITCSDMSKILDYHVVMKEPYTLGDYYTKKLLDLINMANDQCRYRHGPGGEVVEDNVMRLLFSQFIKNYYADAYGENFRLDGSEDVMNLRDVMFDMAKHGAYTLIKNLDRPENGSYFRTETRFFKDTDKVIDDVSKDVIDKNIVEEEAEINKLLIYDRQISGNDPTACYYLTPAGITPDPNRLDRSLNVKTKAVWRTSGQGFREVATENLAPFLYNHKIEMTVAYDSKYIDWRKYDLGDKVKVNINGKTFDSIYTGVSFEYSYESGINAIKMIFGKVRNKASQYWLQKAWQ